VSSTLQNNNVLKRVEVQLQKIQTLTQDVADTVNKIDGQVNEIAGQVDVLVVNFDQVIKNANQAVAKFNRKEMPSKPAIFFGRDQLVNRMSMLLSPSKTAAHICFLGPGGMGKTSLALAVVASPLVQAKFPEKRCVWVPCVEATSGSLFLQVLYTSLRVQRQTDSVLSDIIVELKSSHEPILFLLDNFETPWNTTDGQNEVGDALHKLTQLSHVSILITMRGLDSPTFDVEWHSEIIHPTDKDACRRICEQINPSWSTDHDVDDLLVAVGYMPFAVTLMATRGRQSKSSAKHLLDEWTKLGTDMLSPDGSLETGMNKSICLSVDSNFVKSDPDALYLLATLSLLPAGTTRNRLDYWAPDLKSTSGAIATLSQAALLLPASHDHRAPVSQTLFVLPVIQSFMLHHNRIPTDVQQHVRLACCKFVMDHACRYRDPRFKENADALAREDTNIQSILVHASGDQMRVEDQLIQALLVFTWYRCDTKPHITIAEYTLQVARATQSCRYIAEALLCLGTSYSQVGNYTKAKPLLEESSEMLRALAGDLSAEHLGFECALSRVVVYGFGVSHTYGECGTIIGDVLAKTKDSNSDTGIYWHACALSGLGRLHRIYGRYAEALRVLEKAKNTLLHLRCDRDAAVALFYMAKALNSRESTDDYIVLEAIQEAWEVAKHLEISGIHGHIHLRAGEVLLRMGKLPEALHSFEKALSAFKSVGADGCSADALASIGFLYLHTGAYSDAYKGYKAAADIYAGFVEHSHDGRETERQCRENMEKIRFKLENPERMIEFYKPRTIRD